MVLRSTTAAVVAYCVGSAIGCVQSRADDQWAPSVSFEPPREVWAGAEAFGRVLSIYTGSTFAPFGNLRQDGLRLRAVTAMSRFKYSGLRYDASKGDAATVEFEGVSRTSDLFAGYQWSLGTTTFKVFAGWEIAAHLITPYDPETLVQGRSMGPKGALEIWTNFGHRAWTALDLSYAKAFGAFSTRLRTGWRASETISLGPEISLIGHDESRMVRAGAFLRYDNGVDEISAAAGWTKAKGSDEGDVYVGAQWLRRF